MSAKSHTKNQTNSNETKNDHAPDVVHHEESDTWECPDCGTLKPTREGAEQHCSDDGDDEGLSSSSSHEPAEELQEREQWLMWDASADTPRRPHWKGNFGVSWTDPDEWHGYDEAIEAASERDSWGIGYVFANTNDNYPQGVYGALDLDGCVDEDGNPKDWLPSLQPFFDNGAYMEYSPSGEGIHIPLAGFEDEEWWSDCHFSDKHEGVEAYGSKFFTFTGDRIRNSGDGVADTGEYVEEWLVQAHKAITGEDPQKQNQSGESPPRDYDYASGSGDFDADTASEALEYINPDVAYPTWRNIGLALTDEFSDREALSLFKNWSRRGSKWDTDAEKQADRIINDSSPGGGRRRTIGTVVYYAKKGGWEFSGSWEDGEGHDSVTDALVEEPEVWIDPDSQVITAHGAGGMSADDVADHLRDGELPGDANLFDIASGLDDENCKAFREFWEDGENWTVTTGGSRGDGWGSIRHAYADSDMSSKQARDAAFRQLTEEYSFATFEDGDNILVYNPDKGIYEENGEAIVKSQLQEGIQDQYTKREVSEIVDRIKSASYCKRDSFGADETNPQVCVANGVLDLSEIGSGDEDAEVGFYDHSPARKFLTRLPVEYDPDAECPNFDSFLGEILGNETDEKLIYEMLGYSLWPSYPFAKALFLYGDGANGKSTLLDVFTELLGVDNVSSRSMVALEEDRYAKADLYGSYANIAGDLSNQTLKQTGTLKTLTGGDSVTADEKYKQPFSFKNRAKLVFAANDPPKIEDESSALYRRLLLVNFPEEFTPEGQPGPDAKPKHKLMQEIASESELSGILNKALSALVGVFDRGQFSQNGGAEEVREHYKKISDPVYAFTKDCIKEEQGAAVPKEDVYEAYDNWARENDSPAKDKSVLSRELQTHVRTSTGQKMTNGNKVQVYKGIGVMTG